MKFPPKCPSFQLIISRFQTFGSLLEVAHNEEYCGTLFGLKDVESLPQALPLAIPVATRQARHVDLGNGASAVAGT